MSGKNGRYTPEELYRLLEFSRKPGGTLAPDQLHALIAWHETPEAEREALGESLATTRQQVKAEPLALKQRRGHVSVRDRIAGFLRRS
jgi:hypothetical protein